jgi:hypothetical protein
MIREHLLGVVSLVAHNTWLATFLTEWKHTYMEAHL